MYRTQTMSAEKRKSPRIDLYTQVRIKHEGVYNVKDFGLSGLFIRSPQFKPGDKIELVMSLPEEPKPVRLGARITRVTAEGIGVEFLDVPPRTKIPLEYCFNVFKHTLPMPDSWERDYGNNGGTAVG
ncbi:MAG: PilZ domain-containing protein [Desulfobacterales bacterium]|nr:MAG: PilZ domain-containing protein [Desulfobacterales bacterium]